MPADLGIYKTRLFPVAPVHVYETWIDTSVRVPPIVEMTADVRAGGEVRIEIDTGGNRSVMLGRYLEVVPGARLRYTWQWMHTGDETVVDVRFQPTDQGCRLTLTHAGFSSPGEREAHTIAWEAYLRQIGSSLEAKSAEPAR